MFTGRFKMNETNYKGTGQGTNASQFVKFGRLFYVINPYNHNFGLVEEVPDYIVDVSKSKNRPCTLFDIIEKSFISN